MAALTYGRGLIDTLHERVGDEEQLRGDPGLADDGKLNGVWGRAIVRDVQHRTELGIYGSGPSFKMDSWSLQAGVDIYRSGDDDGARDHAGIYGAYGETNARVTHHLLDQTSPGGTLDLTNFSVGAYWTHFEPGGAYLDGVLQATWLDIKVTPVQIDPVETDGFSLAASLEGGYPIAIGGDWRLEPEAQLVYQTLDIDQTSDQAADIRFRNLDSLAGRIGARLNNVGLEEGWLRFNLWHEFTGKPVTEFSSAAGFVPFEAQLPRTWWEVDAGVSWRLDRNTTLFGSGSFNSTFDGRSKAYDGKIGIRINW